MVLRNRPQGVPPAEAVEGDVPLLTQVIDGQRQIVGILNDRQQVGGLG